MSGLFVFYQAASGGHEAATRQTLSEATLHPATHSQIQTTLLFGRCGPVFFHFGVCVDIPQGEAPSQDKSTFTMLHRKVIQIKKMLKYETKLSLTISVAFICSAGLNLMGQSTSTVIFQGTDEHSVDIFRVNIMEIYISENVKVNLVMTRGYRLYTGDSLIAYNLLLA